jgi:hypothetical protein
MMKKFFCHTVVAAALATVAGVSAQEVEPTGRIPGWSFTPSVTIGTLFDSNIALTSPRTEAGTTEGDTLFTVQPGGELGYFSRRTDFSAAYRGYLRRYTDVEGLNGFDQRGSISLSRAATKRLTFFLNDSYVDAPTTDEIELNGVPFRRAGSKSNRFGGGADVRLTKLTTLSTRYDMTWATFDQTDDFLNNGFIHAGRVNVARQISEHLSVGGDYELSFAEIEETRKMTFQNAGGSVTLALRPHTRLSGGAGISTMFDRLASERHTGPYLRAAIEHATERAVLGASFARQFLPSFGFGGSSRNQDLTGYVRAPLSRRVYTNASFTWRHAVPLLDESIEADSHWLRASIGYLATRWARVEGFYAFSRQDPIDQGGEVNRHRIGAQVVLFQPMRIR